MKNKLLCLVSVLMLLTGCSALPQNLISGSADVSVFQGSVILGRPTKNSIAVSILSDTNGKIYIAYGEKSGECTQKTDIQNADSTAPVLFEIDGLSENKKYYYTVCFKTDTQTEFSKSEDYSLNTPKLSGNTYNFVVQSDSHLLNKADKELYSQSMNNMASLTPDFFIDMGDTFLLDNGGSVSENPTQEKVNEVYRQQLPYFDMVTRNAPLFYVLGNHESEYGPLLEGTKNNLAAMSTIARTTYIPNPVPNDFYTGNNAQEELFGYVQNYYSYTWGDALYVMIDPYRYGSNGASEEIRTDGWSWTLGKVQYDWFRNTLENSNAKFKFVFIHNPIGGISKDSRGGIEASVFYEWGGKSETGVNEFSSRRKIADNNRGIRICL